MSAYTEIALIACALATLVVAAAWVPGVARVFVIAQAAFWSLSYIARPVVLLVVQPDPHYGDNVPDPRLAEYGYDDSIALVLHHVVFGLWVYAALIVGYAIWSRRRSSMLGVAREPAIVAEPDFIPALVAIYVVGILGRGATIAAGATGHAGDVDSSNPILNFVAILGTIAALGLIIFARPARQLTTVLMLAGLLVMELGWTVATESKTPILGAALAVAVRFALVGWTKGKAVGVMVIAVLGIGGFGWLQSFKSTEFAKSESALTNSSYPPMVQPFLSILRRFDLLEAATDAYFHGPGFWVAPDEVIRHAALTLIPAQLLGTEKFQSGTAWANDVRGASVDMTRVSVSLAEGNVNEGYVLGGYAGVVVSVAFTFGLLLAWAKSLYSRYFPIVVLGLAMTGASSLFERGILGSMEALGKFVQSAVLAWLIYLAVKEYRRRARPGPSPLFPPQATPVFIGKRGSGQWV
ncbi:hypothetical protein [Nocardia sp. NPDC057440]|uniref:hypothetical protein n=1 Tax=Nocardia sp. NPDC057440 TaxID=3346134 RepID=UPI00366A91E1